MSQKHKFGNDQVIAYEFSRKISKNTSQVMICDLISGASVGDAMLCRGFFVGFHCGFMYAGVSTGAALSR